MKNRYKILSLKTKNVLKKGTVEILCIVMFTLFCLTAMSCNKLRNLDVGGNTNPPPQNTDSNFTLKGTQWKLMGIVDAQTNTLTELEPKNCEECYTFTFDTDSTFNTYDGSNYLIGTFMADYTLHKVQYTLRKVTISLFGTELAPPGDGGLFVYTLVSVQSFLLQTNELRLYYNDEENYLLFKPLTP